MRTLHISEKEIAKQAGQLFRVVKYGESTVAVCYPGCFFDYNLSCFLERPQILKKYLGKYYKRYLFIPISLHAEVTIPAFIETVRAIFQKENITITANDTLMTLLQKAIDAGREPYFFLLGAQTVPHDELKKIMALVHEQIVHSSRVGAIVFFETNIFKPEIQEVLRANRRLLHQVLYFPVYSSEESLHVVKQICQEWNLKLSEPWLKALVQRFGGMLWILREALRIVRDNGTESMNEIVTKSGLQFRFQTILNLLSETDKTAIVDLTSRNIQSVKENDRQYLESIGFVSEERGAYILKIPWMLEALQQRLTSHALAVDNTNQVFYNGRNLSTVLSASETKVLRLFLSLKGRVVSRDTVAQTIWGKASMTKYSDWAIDQLISRLRKSLVTLGLPKDIITTKKGQGFLIQ